MTPGHGTASRAATVAATDPVRESGEGSGWLERGSCQTSAAANVAGRSTLDHLTVAGTMRSSAEAIGGASQWTPF